MKRTTILLPDDLAHLIDRERRRRGVSTAEIVREALAAHFNVSEQPRRLQIAALGRSEKGDIGQNDEKYLEEFWGSEEFFEEAMGRARAPEERAAAQRHHAIWKPDDSDTGSGTDDRVTDLASDESRVGD